MQQFQSSVYFRCPKCHAANRIEIEVPEFDFSSEHTSNHVSEGEVVILCPSCEYEFDCYAFCNFGGCEFTIYEYKNIKYFGDSPAYNSEDSDDWWQAYEPPTHPAAVFEETRNQMNELLDQDRINLVDNQLLNRMIFTQMVSAFEAYLSDTLVKQIMQNESAMLKFITNDKNIQNEKFNLHQIFNSKTFVKDKIKSHLRNILFHNLPKVKAIYDYSLNINIQVAEDGWKLLLSAMDYRHDCVHRNGYDKEGNRITVFSKPYIRYIVQQMQLVVDNIEKSLHPQLPDNLEDFVPY